MATEAEHVLVLEGHPWYGWRLDCRHEDGPYRCFNPITGETDEEDECPLISWWDEMGIELLSDTIEWPKPDGPEIPVEVDWHAYSGDPVLVPFRPTDDGEASGDR